MKDEFGAWARGTTFLSPNSKLYKMPQVVAAGLTYIAPNVFVAGSLLTTVASYAIYTAGTMWALKQLTPDVPAPASPDLSNRLQPDAPKQVIYGQTRVGGAITYIESVDDNGTLMQVICIAGHPVEEIGAVYINDEYIANGFIGSGSDNGGFVDAANWKVGTSKKVAVFKGNGSNNTSALATLYSKTDNSTEVNSTDFTGNGLSFLQTNFYYNKDIFTNGIPTINAVVKGRKIYDPRKDSTSDAYDASLGVSTHRKTTESTWQYSNNPALCIMDYITQEHGLNTGFDEIDDVEWAYEADLCEDPVTEYDTVIQDRYTLDGVFTRDMAPKEVLPAMLSSCGGSLFFAQGKWVLRVGVYRTPISPVFDEDDLRGPLSIDTKTSRRDMFNAVTGKISTYYDDATSGTVLDWIPTDYPMITSSTFETEDGGRNVLELPLPYTATMPRAQRLAKQTLFKSREQIIVNGKFGLKAFQARVGDNIKLTNARMGWTEKVFEVIGWKFSYGDGTNLEVDLTLKETSSDVYDWSAEGAAFTANNTTLPKFNYAPQPSFDGTPTTEVIIQSDGTTTANADVAWTVSDDSYVNDYVLEWKRTTETNYQAIVTTNLYYRIPSVEVGDTYDLRISSRNRLGVSSDTTTTTVTITADTTAPSTATSLSVDAGFRQNVVKWTNPTDDDFKEVEVYANTTNTSTGATLIGTVSGTEFVHSGLAQNTTRYYFLKTKDFTGNTSGFSTGASGTTLADPAAGEQGETGATGDTVISGRVYYQVLQSGQPSAPTATSYSVSTASFTGLTTDWALTQPQVDITDTSLKEWSSAFTVTIDGSDSTQTIVFTTPTGAVQVADNLESDNYNGGGDAQNQGTQGWHINRDTGYAEFGSAAIRGTLTANQIQIDNVTLDSDGSGNLIIANNGVGSTQLADGAVGTTQIAATLQSTNYVSGTSGWQINKAGTVEFQDATIRGVLNASDITSGTLDGSAVNIDNLNANNITAGTLEADHIKLTGSQLQNSGGSLIISAGGVDTGEIANFAVTNSFEAFSNSGTVTGAGTSTYTNILTITISNDSTSNRFLMQSGIQVDGSGTGQMLMSFGTVGLSPNRGADIVDAGFTGSIFATLGDVKGHFSNTRVISGLPTGTITLALKAAATSGSSFDYVKANAFVAELKK